MRRGNLHQNRVELLHGALQTLILRALQLGLRYSYRIIHAIRAQIDGIPVSDANGCDRIVEAIGSMVPRDPEGGEA